MKLNLRGHRYLIHVCIIIHTTEILASLSLPLPLARSTHLSIPWLMTLRPQNLGASFVRRERCPVRLIAEVAQLYHEERCTQNEIANKLRLSQGTVCRLLKKAEELGIVRTTVIPPAGTFVDLEELLEDKFGLTQVIIARAASDSEESIQRALGAAAAHFLEATLKPREVIGVASWSATLLSMVEQMRRIWKVADCRVVQILGGLGDPSAEEHAHHLVTQLARLVQGEAHFLGGVRRRGFKGGGRRPCARPARSRDDGAVRPNHRGVGRDRSSRAPRRG